MTKEYRQKLASDERHIKHITLDIVAGYLRNYADRVMEWSEEISPVDEDGEPDYEVIDLFSDPLEKGIQALAQELDQQANALVEGCVCYWPDDERVYSIVRPLLKQISPRFFTTFYRNEDEGYRLEVNEQIVYEHLGPDEAIEAARQYVQAKTFPVVSGEEEEGETQL